MGMYDLVKPNKIEKDCKIKLIKQRGLISTEEHILGLKQLV